MSLDNFQDLKERLSKSSIKTLIGRSDKHPSALEARMTYYKWLMIGLLRVDGDKQADITQEYIKNEDKTIKAKAGEVFDGTQDRQGNLVHEIMRDYFNIPKPTN